MLGSSILEVAIGMIFVYLLVSLLLTTLTEIISTYLKMRSNNLWDGICNMVDSSPKAENWVWAIYEHPLIKSLMPPDARRKPAKMRFRPSTKGPSYIPARTFAMVVLDVVKSRGNLEGDSQLGKSLNVLIEDAKGDAEKLKENIEVWFNSSMERVAGWYKRKIQKLQLVLAMGLAIALNVDSLLLMRTLQNNTSLRQSLVAQAEGFQSRPEVQVFTTQPQPGGEAGGGDSSTPQDKARKQIEAFRAFKEELTTLDLPIGWKAKDPNVSSSPKRDDRIFPGYRPGDKSWKSWREDWGDKIGFHFWGWLLTALAASLGAPFWFDMLNKVINIRSSGKAPEEKQKNPKEVPTPVEPGQSPAEADKVRAASGKP